MRNPDLQDGNIQEDGQFYFQNLWVFVWGILGVGYIKKSLREEAKLQC